MNQLLRLQEIFREIFDDMSLRITQETSVESLSDWDSVATVNLVLATEAAFGIRFSTDEVASLKSVKDILGVLEDRQVRKA